MIDQEKDVPGTEERQQVAQSDPVWDLLGDGTPVDLTRDEAALLAKVVLGTFVEAQFQEHYRHTNDVARMQRSWDTVAKLLRSGHICEQSVRRDLEYHRRHFRVCPRVRDLDEAPLHRRVTMTDAQVACTGRAP